MHEIGACKLEDIDVVVQLANRETVWPLGIVRDVEVRCGKTKYPTDFLSLLIIRLEVVIVQKPWYVKKPDPPSNKSSYITKTGYAS
jgi:hypothetical protein